MINTPQKGSFRIPLLPRYLYQQLQRRFLRRFSKSKRSQTKSSLKSLRSPSRFSPTSFRSSQRKNALSSVMRMVEYLTKKK